MNYLTKLYDCFCTRTSCNVEAEKIREQLSEKLDKEQRKLLLAYGESLQSCSSIRLRQRTLPNDRIHFGRKQTSLAYARIKSRKDDTKDEKSKA